MRLFISAACLAAFASVALADGRRSYVTDELTKKECSACHMAYPPGFLPARSWEALTGNLRDHFGEDASLGAEAMMAIRDYLVVNAADASGKARGFARGIPADQTPLRITELPRFRDEHGRFSEATIKKVGSISNCTACHTGAELGYYEDD